MNLLSKAEMRKVMGGVAEGGSGGQATCTITNTQSDRGGTITTLTFETGYYSCSEMSAYTQNQANNTQTSSGGSTHYDCACDGIGV